MNNKTFLEEDSQKRKHTYRRIKKDFIPWNKGLTKETSDSIRRGANASIKTKSTRTYSGWSKGLTRQTDNRIDNIAKMKEGVSRPEEVKLKISQTLSGRKIPDTTVAKMAETQKQRFFSGNVSPWNKGLTKNSNKSLLLMANRKKGGKLSEEHKKNIGIAGLGRIRSESTKLKQSEARLNYLGLHKDEFKWVNTKPEKYAKELFEKFNITYSFQKKVSRYLYDFYLPDHNLLIEIDGVYHHGKFKRFGDKYDKIQLKIMERDILKTKLAEEKGYLLKRVWSDELFEFEVWLKDILLNQVYQKSKGWKY